MDLGVMTSQETGTLLALWSDASLLRPCGKAFPFFYMKTTLYRMHIKVLNELQLHVLLQSTHMTSMNYQPYCVAQRDYDSNLDVFSILA